jgi:hypothetical protein
MLICSVSLSCFRLFSRVLTFTDSTLKGLVTILATVLSDELDQLLRAFFEIFILSVLFIRGLFAFVLIVLSLHFPLFPVQTVEEFLCM